MKDLCIELVDEILENMMDMEEIPFWQENYDQYFLETQELIMTDPGIVIKALLEFDEPNYELIEKIKHFTNL